MLEAKSVFAACCFVLLLSVFTVETVEKRSSYDTRPAAENGTCYKRVPYDEAVIANLSQGLITTESTTPPPGVQSWITIIDCCDGYRRDVYGDCEFYCAEGCGGGNCTGPNQCTCEDGWRAERGECRPTCRQRCPPNAYCFSPDVCECLFGYEMIDGICRPICQHDCRNGDCVGPADCRCHRGYFLNETRHCEPICESGCQHGVCVAPGRCSCDQGYVNKLYDTESCVPECPDECVNGECVTPNVCTCKVGYQQNDNGTCEAQCEQTCPENATCVEPNKCGCNEGFIFDIQGKNCIKLPKNAQNYPNRGGFPSRNNQGQVYNQDPRQGYGGNNVYNTQQNRPYGTQRPGYGQNNNPYGQGGAHQTDNPYGYVTTENPQGVVGLNNEVTTPNPQEGYYLTYGPTNKTPRPQRPFTPQGSYPTSTPYPGIRGSSSTTYRPPTNDPRYTISSPFAPEAPNPTEYPQYNYGNRGNRPINGSSQGPFAPQPPNRFHTTQSPFRPDEPGHTVGPYRTYDSTTQNPWNHNQNHNPYDRTNPNGQQTPNRYPNQRPNPYDQHTTQSPFRPDEPGHTVGPYGPYDSTTQSPWNHNQNRNPYDRTNPNGQQTPNRYPNQRPNPYDQHTTQSPFRPDEPGHTVGPYGPYDSTTQSPWNDNQNRNPYDRTNPNGQQQPNNYPNQRPNPYDQHRPSPYNPYSPISPHGQDGVKTGQRRPNEPQQPNSLQPPYNPYAPVSPHETGVKTPHGRPPYGSQGADQPYNPYAPNTGAPRPPSDIYSRSSVMQSNPQSGIRYSYGIDHLNRVPQGNRPINGQQPGPIPESFMVSDPQLQPGSGNIGGIIIIDGPQAPGVNQLEPFCNGPCINSHCIGLNLCMCEIGFIPDPRNPGGNACVPIQI